MQLITLDDYFMGRDKQYAHELTDAIRKNATGTVQVANNTMALLAAKGIVFHAHPQFYVVSSGWRPPEVNGATPGAAAKSKHMLGLAVDIYDPEGDIDNFLFANQALLTQCAIWIEHPASTKGWSHWQTVPPGSGSRVFYP